MGRWQKVGNRYADKPKVNVSHKVGRVNTDEARLVPTMVGSISTIRVLSREFVVAGCAFNAEDEIRAKGF